MSARDRRKPWFATPRAERQAWTPPTMKPIPEPGVDSPIYLVDGDWLIFTEGPEGKAIYSLSMESTPFVLLFTGGPSFSVIDREALASQIGRDERRRQRESFAAELAAAVSTKP